MSCLYSYVLGKGHLCLRCKKSLNLRFGRTKFSCYDYGAELSFIVEEGLNIVFIGEVYYNTLSFTKQFG